MAGSTWTWIGGTINIDSPSDWTLTAGPVNPTGIPETDDTAINTGTLVGHGVIAASLINSGTVEASNNSAPGSSTGGDLQILGSVSGTGSMTIAPGATLEIGGVLGAGQTIAFSAGAPETLILDSPSAIMTNPITGFADGDKIEIANGLEITSAPIFTNGQTLTINLQNAAGVNSSYAFTNISFAAGTAPAFNWETDPVTDDPAIFPTRFFTWIGASGGNLGSASDWIDGTDGQDPAFSAPAETDTEFFNNGIGGVLTGTTTAEMLFFNNGGTWSIGTGTKMSALQRVFVGGGTNGTAVTGSLAIGSGGTLTSGGNIFVGNGPGGNGTLTVSGGGVLRQNGPANPDNYDLEIASNAASGTLAASIGSVTVTGAGSLIDMGANGIVIAENGGNGSLTVSQGGSVNATTPSSNLYNSIAIGRLGNGTLTVTDPGSRVSASGVAYVAHTETGTLTVENFATFLATPDALGLAGVIIGEGNSNGVGGTGIADVTTGGNLISQGYVIVGLRGTAGDLTVNGGTVQVGTTLALGAGGTITSTGGAIANGTTETGNGTLDIGAGGTVELTGTAQTNSYGVYIATSNNGVQASEIGVATVSGAGALLNANGNGIAVGEYGTGILTVSQGGKVASGTANSGLVAALAIGRQGAGSVIVNGGTLLANGEVYLGRAGSGDLLVENKGSVNIGLDGTGSTSDSNLSVGGAGYTDGTLLYAGGSGSMVVESGSTVTSQIQILVGDDGTNGNLSIDNGLVETSQKIIIGNSTTVAVGDTIATASGTTIVTVPTVETGDGSVDIGPGGTLLASDAPLGGSPLSTSSLVIGNAVGGSGNVTVHGAGAYLSAGNNRLAVGSFGAGSLTITQGGSVDARSSTKGNEAMYIGGSSVAPGAVTVTDPGSNLTTFGELDVGSGGSGNLLIENQASVFTGRDINDPAQGLDVGTATTGSGEVTVTGTHSALFNTGRFVVGDAGEGSLSIQSGGTVTTTPGTVAGLAAATIAASASASGSSVTVTGPGSTFQIIGSLQVGAAGAGLLTLTNGATATATTLDAGLLAGGVGNITVTGPATALTTTGSLSIGDAGAGELSILGGANVTIGGDFNIGLGAGGSGNVDIEDTTGTVYVGGNLNIGQNGGPAVLTVGPGSALEVDNGFINGGPGGVLNLYTSIDPLVVKNLTINVAASDTTPENVTAYTLNDTFNLAEGADYILNTPSLVGTNSFTLGTVSDTDDTTLILNADTVSATTAIAFTNALGTLVIGTDQLATINSPANGKSETNPNDGDAVIGGFHGVIRNFTAGDAIMVNTAGPATFSQSGSVISVIENGTTVGVLAFDTAANAQAAFTAPDALVDNALCFLAGTLIGTPEGQIEVERLAAGDHVRTANGAVRPVMWVGHGRVLATRGRRGPATPVIVRKGALGPNVPHQDLRVTKGHAFWFDGVLIPVEFLVNHRSILWDDRAQEVSVYHVELDAHDVLLANGAAAESYRDDGNRWLFQNANAGWDLPAKGPCAEVLTGGPMVDAVWRRLLEVCGPRPSVPLTADADVHLLVDGVRVEATTRTGDIHVFAVNASDGVRLASRSAVPQELGLARDPRCLGVAVRRMSIRQGTHFRTVRGDDTRLTDGFHAFEPGTALRWTDGDAALPTTLFAGFSGPCELVIHLEGTASYIDDGAAEKVA